MANLKGARTCLETLDMKPNYSELGRIYGIDRRTAKKDIMVLKIKFNVKKILI